MCIFTLTHPNLSWTLLPFYHVHIFLVVNPCVTNQCSNGAQCEAVSSTTYRCLCPPEFTGEFCQNREFKNYYHYV